MGWEAEKAGLRTVPVCASCNRFLESNWFVWVTQMNHIPMHIDYDQNKDWVSTQVRDGGAGRAPRQHCLVGCHLEKGICRTGRLYLEEAGLAEPRDTLFSDLLQLQATCNVHKSAFNDWFSGHLNFQIEHQ